MVLIIVHEFIQLYMGIKGMSEKERETVNSKIIDKAAEKYGEFLEALGFNWKKSLDMKDTPKRVAKMMVNDIFKSCYNSPPDVTTFKNKGYDGMVFEGDIEIKSIPFFGRCFLAYIPTKKGRIIGLSKLNRLVEYCCRKPQVQENLTMEIHDLVNKLCKPNLGVAVVIEASHTCVSHRGIRQNSVMKTSKLSKDFLDSVSTREEFYNFIKDLKK